MNTMTYEPEYIPIEWKPRLIASCKGLLAFAFSIYQVWYLVLFEHSLILAWSNSFAALRDPVNSLLNMFLHSGLTGIVLGYTVIALRSGITGYAPTKGTVTYRSFGARFQTDSSGDVHISEESPSIPVALVGSQSLEDCVDASYSREGDVSFEVSLNEKRTPQEETHEMHDLDELPREAVKYEDEQGVQQSNTTRALIVYPEQSKEKEVPEKQTAREVEEIRKILYLLVSFFRELTVSVVLSVGSVIKRCQVNLDNRLKSFVGFLATRAKGTRLEQNDFKGQVFHAVEDGSLHQAKYDLIRKVHKAIKELDSDYPEIEVLELRSRKKRATYYNALSEAWYPFLPSELELLAYHSFVRDIQADLAPTLNIPLQEWRRLYQRVIVAYNEKGFLGEHIEKDEDHRWCWAEAPYLHIRDGQLIFIFFCAGHERKSGQQSDDPQTRQECLEQEAWLWREAVYTAITYHPDLKRGEYALRRYLELCDLLGWHEAARGVINQCYRLLDRFAPGTKFKPETLSLIEKVTTPLQIVDKDEE